MGGTEMSPVEHREAERRVKTMLFCSMVGVLVGLLGATLIESDHRKADPGHPGSVPQDQRVLGSEIDISSEFTPSLSGTRTKGKP